MDSTKLLTISALADRWSRHPKTMYAQVAARQIPFVRLGPRAIRFRLEDVERLEEDALVSARGGS